MRRDPRVAVSVPRGGDPYDWISINGTVEELIEGDEALAAHRRAEPPLRPRAVDPHRGPGAGDLPDPARPRPPVPMNG